jgi:hypothetical protein
VRERAGARVEERATHLNDRIRLDEVSTAADRDCRHVGARGRKGVQRSEQQLDVREAASAVCVGHEESAAAGVQHALTHSATLPAVALELHDPDVRFRMVFRRKLECCSGGAIGGAVVYDEDLKGAFGE